MKIIQSKSPMDFLEDISNVFKEESQKGLNPKIKLSSQSKQEGSKTVETSVLIFSSNGEVTRISYDSDGKFFETWTPEDYEKYTKSDF